MKRWSAALLVLLVACEPQAPNGMAEVARELRSLRQALPSSAPASVDKGAITEALAPLREALQGMASEQARLQQQQTALTEELRRWAALVAQTATAGPRQELEALQQRLQTFETQLQEQGARHRQSEELLERALNGTADRLDEFLKRLDALRSPGKETAEPPPPAPEGGEAARTGMSRGGVRGSSPWWLGLLGAATIAGGWLGWRLLMPMPTNVAAEEDSGASRETAELWAAAAMLGEAVGRLRQAAAETPPGLPPADDASTLVAPPEPEPAVAGAAAIESGPAPAPTGPEPPLDIDDVFILDDEEFVLDGDSGARPAVDEPARAGPPWLRLDTGCRNPHAASSAAAHLLAADPRVLRLPAPRIESGPGTVVVEFAVLPALVAGEHDHLLGELRAAIHAA